MIYARVLNLNEKIEVEFTSDKKSEKEKKDIMKLMLADVSKCAKKSFDYDYFSTGDYKGYNIKTYKDMYWSTDGDIAFFWESMEDLHYEYYLLEFFCENGFIPSTTKEDDKVVPLFYKQ